MILTSFSLYPQQNTISILENLSFQDQEISLKEISKETDYLNNMKFKRNFMLSNPANTCCKFVIFYIKSINNLSVFVISTEDEVYGDENYNILSSSDLILYDSIYNKCLYFEYERGLSGSKIRPDTLLVSCDTNKFLSRIIGLDNKLIPYSSISFPSYFDTKNNYLLITYFDINSNCKKNSEVINLNLNEITLKDLYNLLDKKVNTDVFIPCNSDESFVIYHFKPN